MTPFCPTLWFVASALSHDPAPCVSLSLCKNVCHHWCFRRTIFDVTCNDPEPLHTKVPSLGFTPGSCSRGVRTHVIRPDTAVDTPFCTSFARKLHDSMNGRSGQRINNSQIADGNTLDDVRNMHVHSGDGSPPCHVCHAYFFSPFFASCLFVPSPLALLRVAMQKSTHRSDVVLRSHSLCA